GTQGVSATVAVWAYATQPVGLGNTLTVYFPGNNTNTSGFIFEADTSPYLYMKYTDLSGNFTPNEVTITAAYSQIVSPHGIQVTIPDNMGKGQFYVRFDSAFGLLTPTWPGSTNSGGTCTVVLGDPLGKKTVSSPFFLSPT